MATFELSAKKQKNGRRPFVAGLYELQPPSCVVDDVGTKYNENGITFLEEYCEKQKDSIKDMSVTVEFIDDDRTQILGHGLTDVQDGMPIFENSTVVGHFTEGFIQDMEIDGETKRIMCGRGFLDEMRYPHFIANLEAELQNGNSVDGSIEIYKSEGNEGIVYKKGYLPKGRIPTEFIHSGWAMVLNPADSTSTLLELNSKTKKEEKVDMDEKELKALIESTIIETNSQNDDLNKQISELNTQISEKDNQIVELNASIEKLKAELAKMNEEQDTWWEERDILRKKIAEIKVAQRLAELDEAVSEFNEDEKAVAADDIDKLKSEINDCKTEDELDKASSEINTIVSKICREIVSKQKKAEAEQNALEINSQQQKKETEVADIFSEICEETPKESEDIDIFA